MYKENLKIGIIGVGGRTGTMFFQELKNLGNVFGIGREKEIEEIKEKKLFVEKNGKLEKVEGNLIREEEFPKEIQFDFLFLTVKNPVANAVKYYYGKIKEKNFKPPVLFLSQNGIEASNEALLALEEIFGKEIVSVFRISLFNPVEKRVENGKFVVSYSLPIKIALGKISGPENEEELKSFFKKTKIKAFFIPPAQVKNMEYSKLFLNLIGMASATRGLSLKEGFSKKEVFLEEIEAMREYIKVVRAVGGNFLNFPGYPVRIFSHFFSLPIFLLLPFRKIFGRIIERGRLKKPKDLDEIDYYNGVVVRLGKSLKIATPINEKILKRIKK